MDKITISEYNKGWRAYIDADGDKIFQDTTDGFIMAFQEEVDAVNWDNLRAYQDEQRKKGEPVRIKNHIEWYARTYAGFDFNTAQDNDSYPVILVSEAPLKIMDEPWGQFTNFRWKPGHGPK